MSDPRVEEIEAILNIQDQDVYLEDARDALTSLARDLERAEDGLRRIRDRRLGTLNEDDADDFHDIARAYFREKE